MEGGSAKDDEVREPPPPHRLAVCALAVTSQRFAGTGQAVPLWYKSAKCPLPVAQQRQPNNSSFGARAEKFGKDLFVFVCFSY